MKTLCRSWGPDIFVVCVGAGTLSTAFPHSAKVREFNIVRCPVMEANLFKHLNATFESHFGWNFKYKDTSLHKMISSFFPPLCCYFPFVKFLSCTCLHVNNQLEPGWTVCSEPSGLHAHWKSVLHNNNLTLAKSKCTTVCQRTAVVW